VRFSTSPEVGQLTDLDVVDETPVIHTVRYQKGFCSGADYRLVTDGAIATTLSGMTKMDKGLNAAASKFSIYRGLAAEGACGMKRHPVTIPRLSRQRGRVYVSLAG
jgi:hypothetical protein